MGASLGSGLDELNLFSIKARDSVLGSVHCKIWFSIIIERTLLKLFSLGVRGVLIESLV